MRLGVGDAFVLIDQVVALGELDEIETARVARHARTCDECAHRLGEAEEAVAAAIDAARQAEALGLDEAVTINPSGGALAANPLMSAGNEGATILSPGTW